MYSHIATQLHKKMPGLTRTFDGCGRPKQAGYFPDAIALLQSARRPREVLHEDFPGWHSGLLAGMKDEVHHGSMLFKPLVHRQRKKGQGR